MDNMTFAQLGIADAYIARLKEDGVLTPTPIQQAAIPVLLEGHDLIAQAQTGTGKTLAFALPLLKTFNPDEPHVQGLIITPTRELALQITAELNKLAPLAEARILAIYGGQDVEAQIRKLRNNAAVIVATPGRLLDHLRRGTVDLSKVSKLVLDEADQMLHMGFLTDVELILAKLPLHRQTMLFSATMPEPVKRLARGYMNQPRDVRIQGKQVTLEEITQFVLETTDRGKQEALFRLLELYQPFLAVIFCRTKIRAKKLADMMYNHGFNVGELHGDLSQSKREQVMEKFRKADLQYLVATDVAARGLDIEGVTHVFNYDIPPDPEWYIHRIGRTGRARQTGTAITFVAPKDRSQLLRIEQGIHSSLKRCSIEELDPRGDSGDGGDPAKAAPDWSAVRRDGNEAAGRGRSATRSAAGKSGKRKPGESHSQSRQGTGAPRQHAGSRSSSAGKGAQSSNKGKGRRGRLGQDRRR